jgi:hypothetical protein
MKLEAIAEACRPMAALLLGSAAGTVPPDSELAAARRQLAIARSAPGRIGWAVRIVLEGTVVGSRMKQATGILERVAGLQSDCVKPDFSDLLAYGNVLHALRTTEGHRDHMNNHAPSNLA